MKKSVCVLLGITAFLTGCRYEEPFVDDSLAEFDVSLESIVSDSTPETKTFADAQHLVLWHNDDRVSVFEKKEYWEEYKYTGRTGTTGGRLIKVSSEGSGTGGDLDYYYAVYPHSELNGFDNNGHLLLTLPNEQPYDEFSFGRGTNLMVAASEDNNFRFKNIGGYLVFKLYGEGVSVSSIRLTGNKGEEISGDIDVVISPGVNPVVTMSTARYAVKYNEVELVCDSPVALGATSSDYKEFWFVLPPMTFEKGFSIEVTTSDGSVWTKTTNKAWTITRNHYTPVTAMEVKVEPSGNIEFADPEVKRICVENWDTNGDGELSYAEAAAVTSMNSPFKSNSTITSFDEFQYFTGIINDAIGMFPFADCSNLISIVLPESITRIPTWMFRDCSCLKSIIIPQSITSIDSNAFQRCSSLLNISIPDSVISIGSSAFDGCSSLCSIHLPESVTSLGQAAFRNCNNLTSVNIPSSITSIEDDTFYACVKLTSISIPETVTSIGSYSFYAFSANNHLSSIVLSQNVTEIGDYAFYESGISSLYVYAIQPPTCGVGILLRADYCSIYVPAESVEAYKIAPNWSDYANRIQAIPTPGYINGHAYVEMGDGLKWATMNVGANNPEEYGDYFAWGETAPYYVSLNPRSWKEGKSAGYDWGSYQFNPSGDGITFTRYTGSDYLTLLSEDDAATANWGGTWRTPTSAEWLTLSNTDNYLWTWGTQNGANGYIVESRVLGYEGNTIFLPAAGYCYEIYQPQDKDYDIFYWSSSISEELTYTAYRMSLHANSWNVNFRYYGESVRPVSE